MSRHCSVSPATTFLSCGLLRIFPIRTLVSRTEEVVEKYEEFCLFSLMLELWRASRRRSWTHEDPSVCVRSAFGHSCSDTRGGCAAFGGHLPRGRLGPTERRAKTYHWINLTQHGEPCSSCMKWRLVQRWNGNCTCWLRHSLPNQTSWAMESCHRCKTGHF